MASKMNWKSNPEGWDELVKHIIETKAVPMMQRVADECNVELAHSLMEREAERAGHAHRLNLRERAIARLAVYGGAFSGEDGESKGFMVSVEGDKPLEKHDYRATVITASAFAMNHNAKHNTLVSNFHLASESFR